MIIAIDLSTDGGNTTGTSLTFSHTVTGSNPFLVVDVIGDVANDKITGVTYNGVAMTLPANGKVLITGDRYLYSFVLANPATGAHNVVITASSSILIQGIATSYTGAQSSSTVDNSTNNTDNTVTSLTTSLTTVADNCWVHLFAASTDVTIAAGTGTTNRKTTTNPALAGDNNAAKTPAGSVSMQVTNNGSGNSRNYGAILISFAPGVAVPATTSTAFSFNFM